jgi:hypothetical protein
MPKIKEEKLVNPRGKKLSLVFSLRHIGGLMTHDRSSIFPLLAYKYQLRINPEFSLACS